MCAMLYMVLDRIVPGALSALASRVWELGLGPGRKRPQQHVHVTCTCNMYMYMCETCHDIMCETSLRSSALVLCGTAHQQLIWPMTKQSKAAA
jgi:hypothetical protein